MMSNLDETFLNELNSTIVDGLFPTHFNLANADDSLLAYSLIKKSAVPLEQLATPELLHLTDRHCDPIVSRSDESHVRGPKSIRFTCPICGLITVTMERLRKHVSQHGQILHLETSKSQRKISSFSCARCKASFSSTHALRKHQRVHTRDKPFSCDFCDSKFSQWGNLRHHIQRHLGVSPYACPYCKKTFIAPCKLEVHIRGHLDERPYVCDRCQATFRCNDDLRKHLIIHADYKPFVCWLCTKEFFHASKLRLHMKEKHHLDVAIKKKDVLESGTEYEVIVHGQQSKAALTDAPTIDSHVDIDSSPLLNELNVTDIETFILADCDLRNCSQEHHHNPFDDLQLIDFPVM